MNELEYYQTVLQELHEASSLLADVKKYFYYDSENLIWNLNKGRSKKGDKAGSLSIDGYIRITFNQNSYLVHRLIWLYHYGELPPSSMYIDHINLNKSDNRICNLRLATSSDNQRNKPSNKNNTSGHKGVRWNKSGKKWQAQATVNKKVIYLGLYNDKEDASKAYEDCCKIHYGDFYHKTSL